MGGTTRSERERWRERLDPTSIAEVRDLKPVRVVGGVRLVARVDEARSVETLTGWSTVWGSSARTFVATDPDEGSGIQIRGATSGEVVFRIRRLGKAAR